MAGMFAFIIFDLYRTIFQGLLGSEAERIWFEIFDCLRAVLSGPIPITLDQLQQRVMKATAQLRRILELYHFTQIYHQLAHFSIHLLAWGPPNHWSGWGMERKNGLCKRIIHNKVEAGMNLMNHELVGCDAALWGIFEDWPRECNVLNKSVSLLRFFFFPLVLSDVRPHSLRIRRHR